MENTELYGLNLNYRRCGLTAGTTNTFTTTVDIHYSLRGRAASAAAISNAAPPTTDYNTGQPFIPVGPNEACVFVFSVDGTGTLDIATRVMQGSIVELDGSTNGASANYVNALSQFPTIQDTVVPYGWVVVKVGAGASPWTFGVSNFAGPPTNTSITFTSGSVIPDRPRST